MRNSYEVRARKFIRQIYNYICECEDVVEYEWAVNKFNHDHHRNVQIANGLTRVVLITSDYVIKMNCGYASNLSRWGTCETEIGLYKEAVRDGFDYLFAKPTEIEYQGLTFCIMPRITGIGRTPYDADEYLTEEEKDWVWERVSDLHNGNYGWRKGRPVIIDYAAVL